MKVENERIMDISPTQIRIPSELKERIKSSAKSNMQTISAEIVYRLEESFAKDTNELLEKIEQMREETNQKLDDVLRRLDTKA